jgi:hypothetical protein
MGPVRPPEVVFTKLVTIIFCKKLHLNVDITYEKTHPTKITIVRSSYEVWRIPTRGPLSQNILGCN